MLKILDPRQIDRALDIAERAVAAFEERNAIDREAGTPHAARQRAGQRPHHQRRKVS